MLEELAMDTRIHLSRRNSGVAFEAGEVIFQQGDNGDRMYIIVEGEIDILHDGNLVDTLEVG
jgi:CRP-like cAMP-binding protein